MTSVPTMPRVSISKLTFSDNDSFDIEENQTVILVGANNSGKSQTLREIVEFCKNNKPLNVHVLKDLNLDKCNKADFVDFLNANAELIDRTYYYSDWKISDAYLDSWDRGNLIGDLSNAYIKNITASNRLSICQQQESISNNEPKTKPQHLLYRHNYLMDKISKLFMQAFGKELIINFKGGNRIPIHVSPVGFLNDESDRLSDTYIDQLEKLPLLDKQGDGMKSYAGILFESIVNKRDITLIDEPEAFLHPPQMRKLGETLAREIEGQSFVATHSSDILRGFLEGTQGNVKILRINRVDDKNVVMEANEETIKELWEKPVLRYSNALEGIFHEQTIICEDDSDCRLINSVGDYLALDSLEHWKDTAYVPAGGKHAIPKIANILREMGVPTKAVFDIDFLSEERLVKETIVAFGGVWEDIEALWNQVNNAIKNKNPLKNISDIKEEAVEILTNSSKDELPSKEIIKTLKQTKPWHEVKSNGEVSIPGGQVLIDYKAIKVKLEEIGIYIIPVGEIENFCREISGHGPKFITTLLTEKNMNDQDLSDLRNFVEKVHLGGSCRISNG